MDRSKNIVDPFIEIADQDVDYGGQFYLWDWAHDLRAYRDTWREPEQKPHEERNFIFSIFGVIGLVRRQDSSDGNPSERGSEYSITFEKICWGVEPTR